MEGKITYFKIVQQYPSWYIMFDVNKKIVEWLVCVWFFHTWIILLNMFLPGGTYPRVQVIGCVCVCVCVCVCLRMFDIQEKKSQNIILQRMPLEPAYYQLLSTLFLHPLPFFCCVGKGGVCTKILRYLMIFPLLY